MDRDYRKLRAYSAVGLVVPAVPALYYWLDPLVGATSLIFVNEGHSTFVKAEPARISYGSLFIVMIILMPYGIINFIRKRRQVPTLGQLTELPIDGTGVALGKE
jgi:hypothetical protein